MLTVALDGVEAAALAFEPTLRTGADGLFAGLRALGVVPVLTSAEGAAVAQPWADRLDARDCLFELDPAARAAVVAAMRGAGHLVACLGADVADHRALAAADVAIAIDPRDAATRAAADLTLAGVPLGRLPALVALARDYHRGQGRAITLSVLGAGTMGLGAIVFGFGPVAALAGQVAGLIGGAALVSPDVTPIAALPSIEPSPERTPAPGARPARALLAAVPS
ncbi:MAG: hypothetical protein H6701_10625 [Myxococcales bacterium]|nr:hypothetical protein [Myxococcales bacterium]